MLRQLRKIDRSVVFVLGGSDELTKSMVLTADKAVIIDASIDVKSKTIVRLDDLDPNEYETSK